MFFFPSQMARWKAITALDVVTEVLLLALPAWLVSRNRVKASSKRVVVFVFSFRLVVAAFSLATMSVYFRFLHSGTARDSIGLVPTVISIEAMLCASLITASIPSLRSFLWAFMSRGVFTMYGVDTSASQGGSHGASIPMHSMGRSQTDGDNPDVQHRQPRSRVNLRPEWLGYRVDVRAASRVNKPKHTGDERSVNSDGSERMIIHRQVEFDVHED
jgi:hypothetical protein